MRRAHLILVVILLFTWIVVAGESTQHVNVRMRPECFIGDITFVDCDLNKEPMACKSLKAKYRPGCGEVVVTR